MTNVATISCSTTSRRRFASPLNCPASRRRSLIWRCSKPTGPRILAETERFLGLEKEDDKKLDRLAKELKDVRDTTMWELVVRLMRHDNEKHRRILELIRDRARVNG
jgi:hypothetical protein